MKNVKTKNISLKKLLPEMTQLFNDAIASDAIADDEIENVIDRKLRFWRENFDTA